MKPIAVYMIQNKHNCRVYIGQSVDPRRRFREHGKKPPTRMREDWELYRPFQRHFSLSVLGTVTSKYEADQLERDSIFRFAARGPQGYNDLEGKPTASKKFWLLRRRGVL